MEQKKSPQADMEQRRTTGFLLGLIFVLSVFYVAMEWNSAIEETPTDLPDLDELVHESELVPMSNEETVAQFEEQKTVEKAEQLNIVDDAQELEEPAEQLTGETEGADGELLPEQDSNQDKPLEALGVDPANPLNFHVVEDLPQFPGGAVEFMKWLTRHLRYPNSARQKKVEGKVVAVFYIEKTGKVTNVQIVQPLSPECDREALRVLRLMPDWKPGVQNDQPCRTKVSIPIVFKL